MRSEEKTKELSQKLVDGVRQTFESNRFQQYLIAVSLFHSYSPRNTALIFFQKPDATRVAGFDAWKKLGRYVRRGETGISIFAPVTVANKVRKPVLDDNGKPLFDENGDPKTEAASETRIWFRPVTVFDVSQTEGKPLPELCGELQGTVPDLEKIFSAVQKISPYKIVFEKMPGEEKGYCSYAEKKIALKPGMSDAQIVKTVLHEYAHAVLHKGVAKSREQKEIEAESVAFLVSDSLGVDTSGYSFDYVSVWSHGMETEQLQEMLESIQTDANEIISRVDAAIKEIEKEQKRMPLKLPARLSEAAEISERLGAEKEAVPNAKLLAQ